MEADFEFPVNIPKRVPPGDNVEIRETRPVSVAIIKREPEPEHDDEDEPEEDAAADADADESEADPGIAIVDYCLLCGQIAVLYNFDGKMIKKERPNEDVSHADLFEGLCKCMGIRKNSKLRKDWNWDSDPFPFCESCEDFINSLVAMYSKVDELEGALKARMVAGEEKYVTDELYDKHDGRYFDFRKHVLGESFRGNTTTTANAPERVLRSTRSSQRSRNTDEVEVSVMEPVGIVEPPEHSEPEPSTSRRRSQRLRKLDPEDDTAESSLKIESITYGPEAAAAEVTECTFSNGENSYSYEEESILPNETEDNAHNQSGMSSSTQEHSDPTELHPQEQDSSFDSGCQRQLRRRTIVQPNYLIPSDSSDEEELDYPISKEEDKENSKRENLEGVEVVCNGNDNGVGSIMLKSSPISKQNHIHGRRRGRKRGGIAKPEIPLEKKRMRKAELDDEPDHDQYDHSMDANDTIKEELLLSDYDSGGDEIYSRNVPLVHCPITQNIYFRTLLFVRLEETKCFQCSTCSDMIPFGIDGKMHDKFHSHFLRFHSDRFECQYCVDARFSSNGGLWLHMRTVHKSTATITKESPVSKQQKRPYRRRSEHTKCYVHRKKGNLTPCPICGKPVPASGTEEYKVHWFTHLNAVEKKEMRQKALMEKRARAKKLTQRKDLTKRKRRYQLKTTSYSIANRKRNARGRRRGRKAAAQTANDVALCRTCREFIPKSELRNHKLTHVQDEERPMLLCPICGAIFTRKNSLKCHVRSKHPNAQNLYKCMHLGCGCTFDREEDFQLHMTTIHG